MEMVQMQRRFVEYATSLLHEGFLDALDQQNVDFKRVDSHVHQLKGSSSSIGPQRVKNVCIAFRNYCEEQNTDACLSCLQQVKQEYSLIKSTLETLFRLEQQILIASENEPCDLLSGVPLFSMAKMIKYIKDSTAPLNKRSERLVDNKIANNGGIVLSTY
ncbi:hypothetical protein VitviT2T_021571 [Vitis vinifera]|uniref:Histidine-containing phosphotransfer protein n=1 Tax=Vitis vinifera TaxID=29760 RepID=A0ABY9D8U9_VITVI|nr:hypothetical protein VitviT2T_021571 [Vitis vinifera]